MPDENKNNRWLAIDIPHISEPFGTVQINRARLFIFDREGHLSENILNSGIEEKRSYIRLLFETKIKSGEYSFVLVTNEQNLENAAQNKLNNFDGTKRQLLRKILMSRSLLTGSSLQYMAHWGASDPYMIDIESSATAHNAITLKQPLSLQWICARVEVTVTNQLPDGSDFITPESAGYKIRALRRIDIRNTSSLFPVATSNNNQQVISQEVTLNGQGMTGTNATGHKFTFTDQFYAGDYSDGKDFSSGEIDNTNPQRRTSAAYFIQLENTEGKTFDYIIPIGDPLWDAEKKLIGTKMERNVSYKINIFIKGSRVKQPGTCSYICPPLTRSSHNTIEIEL